MIRNRLDRALRRQLRDHPWARTLRLARLRRQASGSGHVDWSRVIRASGGRWAEALRLADGPRVLIATNVGINFAASRMDSLLSVALTLRGARVEHVLCNEALPACMAADQSWYPDYPRFERHGLKHDLCPLCFAPTAARLAPLGLPLNRLGDLIGADERCEVDRWAATVDPDEVRDVVVEGVAVGEAAFSGTLRFLARGTLPVEAHPVLRAYLKAARLTQLGFRRLAADRGYDAAVLHHGIYVPQGAAAAVLRTSGTRIVTWFPAYRKRCFVFSHDDTYHRTMVTEPASRWEGLELDAAQLSALRRYLDSRRTGEHDWISFNRNPDLDFETFARDRGIDLAKPIIGLLTNVFWDAQLHYPANAFGSMRDWLVETVRYFAGRPELQLVIRAHPAEASGAMPARETAQSILETDVGKLPANVFLVGPAERISTYVIAPRCRACIIFATKAGIELLTMGVPVIAAGESWVRNKGMAGEAADKAGYYALLDRLPDPPRDMTGVVERAERYAFHFFFRRMIPVHAAVEATGWPPFGIRVEHLEDLERGADPGLDTICAGILEGAPFEYPAERFIDQSEGSTARQR
jgi:hypothetical protein